MCKHTKRELGQHPAMLTSRLVSNPYMYVHVVLYHAFKLVVTFKSVYKLCETIRSFMQYLLVLLFCCFMQVLPTIPRDQRNRVAHFLEKQGFKQQALAVSCDPEHRYIFTYIFITKKKYMYILHFESMQLRHPHAFKEKKILL